MVRAISAFLDFCYLARRDVLDETTLNAMDDALKRFHADRVIFQASGVRPSRFSLPRQHSMMHYRYLIQKYGAPNGLCSSITESKHIKAVKEPWRRSSHFEAEGQMLLTNQRLDKLAASRVDFVNRGMLNGPCLPLWIDRVAQDEAAALDGHGASSEAIDDDDNDDDDEDPAVDGPRYLGEVTLAVKKSMWYELHSYFIKLIFFQSKDIHGGFVTSEQPLVNLTLLNLSEGFFLISYTLIHHSRLLRSLLSSVHLPMAQFPYSPPPSLSTTRQATSLVSGGCIEKESMPRNAGERPLLHETTASLQRRIRNLMASEGFTLRASSFSFHSSISRQPIRAPSLNGLYLLVMDLVQTPVCGLWSHR